MSKLLLNANIVDVLKKKTFQGSILIQNGRIANVAEKIKPVDEVEIIDLNGATVMPGLFNCHVHVTLSSQYEPKPTTDAERTLMAQVFMRQLIENGITYVRDVGAFNFIDVNLRDAVARKAIIGPDIYACGQCICMTGGHGWRLTGCNIQADGADEVRKAARLMIRNGVDGIKLIATGGVMTKGTEISSAQLTEKEMCAACEEIHKVGGTACAHAQGTQGIKNALRAGVDSIEHGIFLDEECIELMKKRNVYYVPTISALHWIMRNTDSVEDYIVRKSATAESALYESIKKAHAAGIKICMGTDSGTPFNMYDNATYELELLVKAGLTPMEAVMASTIHSAELCHVEKELGSISVGKKAHLAVFRENPVENIEAIRDCIMTIKNGEIVYQKNR